jgi:hypothetical protein
MHLTASFKIAITYIFVFSFITKYQSVSSFEINDEIKSDDFLIQKRDTSNVLTYEQIKYSLELYLKYYELIEDDIFQNAAQKKKITHNFIILKNKLIDMMNQSEANKKLMYNILKKHKSIYIKRA